MGPRKSQGTIQPRPTQLSLVRYAEAYVIHKILKWKGERVTRTKKGYSLGVGIGRVKGKGK